MRHELILVLELLALFGIKHFVCDFMLQTPAMLKDKGTYGAIGGLKHAFCHSIGTLIILFIALPWNQGAHAAAVILAGLDGVIHYHIDWAKTNLTKGYTPTDKEFWLLLGADQGLHYLTYIGLIAILVLL
jgi:Protein of unknown function (DUF3307)